MARGYTIRSGRSQGRTRLQRNIATSAVKAECSEGTAATRFTLALPSENSPAVPPPIHSHPSEVVRWTPSSRPDSAAIQGGAAGKAMYVARPARASDTKRLVKRRKASRSRTHRHPATVKGTMKYEV